MHILIAEDETRIARFMYKGLTANGYTCTIVSDGIEALDYASTGDADLLILDVGLPRMDGFTVLRNLRDMGVTLPIIMVTARTAVEDTVQGFETGANDYITKPFRFEELLARVRVRIAEPAPPSEAAASTLSCGDLSLDLRNRVASISRGGTTETAELSSREFGLATVFLENPNQVLTREQLLSKVWGYDFDGSSNIVDVYVKALRSKLGASRFVTVRGAGYKLVESESTD